MSVIEMIRLLAPEFSEVYDDVLEKWIEMFSPLVSKQKFGKLYNQALALMICHKLKMAGKGDTAMGLAGIGSIADGFTVSSVSDGGTSISLASGGMNNLQTDAEFALTVYGTQYLQLRKMVIMPITISE